MMDSTITLNGESITIGDTTLSDNVNSPDHYNFAGIECIDAIQAMLSPEEFVGYLRGNSLKYRWRFRYKNGLEDLEKAEWYEKRLKKAVQKLDS